MIKRYLFQFLLVAAFLSGCASLRTERKVEGNVFYSSSPKMVVELSSDYKYLGRKGEKIATEEVHRGSQDIAFGESFTWESSVGWLVVTFRRSPDRVVRWVHPSYEWKNVPNVQDTGQRKLGNHTYDYCVYKDKFGSFGKLFLRNTSDDLTRVQILFVSKLQTISLGEFEKDCKNAFQVHTKDYSKPEQGAEKVASLPKPDSSPSNNSFDEIIGHWMMEGETMVIEEIDNGLSIRMDRLRGYHLGPSGQAKYRETTHSHNISWDGKHLEFEIWMPSGAGAYEVSYSLTLSGQNTLFGTKQASGSSLKIEVEFEK